MNRSAVAGGVYLAAGALGLVIANGDQNNVIALWALVAVPALALGWIAGGGGWAAVVPWLLLPWLLLLVALPFGDANKFTGGDDTDPLTLLVIFPAVLSMLLIVIAAAGRRGYERSFRTSPKH
jgi:hypothetical protein